MKTYNFNTSELNKKSNDMFFIPTDYSKIIDDIIISDVVNKNSYLFKTPKATTCIIDSGQLKNNTSEFIKAAKFLANYKEPKKNKLKFIIGKTYYLIDGTPIIFYDDEIQIGFDLYKYKDFDSDIFIQDLDASKKKTIIDIYTNIDNLKININL